MSFSKTAFLANAAFFGALDWSNSTKNFAVSTSVSRNAYLYLDRHQESQYWQVVGQGITEFRISAKRAVSGSILPEKMEFDGKTFRTARMNVIANHIFQINNELSIKKNRANESKFHLSCFGSPAKNRTWI